MAIYERRTRVAAPLDRVWAFHESVDGLVALTPGWLRLRLESAVGPDGEPSPDPVVLQPGTEVRLSVRPFGVGPRQAWTSRITRLERSEAEVIFADEMIRGPMPRWVHTHRFRAVDGETEAIDRVEYTLPVLPPLSPLARIGFEPLFAYRHRRLRTLIE